MEEEAAAAASRLFGVLSHRRERIVFAESCTGGLLSALLTELPGSSALLWGGFVVYTEAAKESLLGVSPLTLARHGAVSRETAREMAAAALARSGADAALAITGFAGPEAPENEGGPGRVVIAWARRKGNESGCAEYRFAGSRHEVRYAAATAAFKAAIAALADR